MSRALARTAHSRPRDSIAGSTGTTGRSGTTGASGTQGANDPNQKPGQDFKKVNAALRYSDAPKHEYFAVRNSVGVFDTSPLFKYRVYGPDSERLWMRSFA